MIFIKNKRAWKEFLRDHQNLYLDSPPKEYPFYANFGYDDLLEIEAIEVIYKSELQSMLEKLENGREF